MISDKMFNYVEEDGLTLIASYDETKSTGILKMITLPEKTPEGKIVKGIKSLAFIDCKFNEVIIPKTYKKFEKDSFVSCTKLELIKLQGDIPSNLSEIFLECRDDICFFVNSLEEVKTIEDTKGYCFFLGEIDFDKTKYTEDKKTIRINDISDFIADRTDVYIPNVYKGKKVLLDLKNEVTYLSTMTDLNITYYYAEEQSFDELKKIEYLRINNFCFPDTNKIHFENLKAINLGSNNRVVTVPIFPVKRLTIPDKTVELNILGDPTCFTEIEALYLPNGLKTFDLSVIKQTKFIRNYLRKDSGLYIIDDYLIGMEQRTDCPSEIEIPKEVKAVSRFAFAAVNIKSVRFNNKIKEIPNKCFFNCRVLSEVYLPENIEEIHEEAFTKTYLRKKLEMDNPQKVSYFIKNKKCKISEVAFNQFEDKEIIYD